MCRPFLKTVHTWQIWIDLYLRSTTTEAKQYTAVDRGCSKNYFSSLKKDHLNINIILSESCNYGIPTTLLCCLFQRGTEAVIYVLFKYIRLLIQNQ